MKKIWIIAPFSEIETVDMRNRFQYLANLLNEEGFEVSLFTSKFSHIEKKHITDPIVDNYSFQVKLMDELGYKKNVSVRRAVSHLIFTKNLKKAIKKMHKPDLIYAAYPTMSAAKTAGRYAKKNKIPFILDVQDIWPESISSAVNIENPLIKCLLRPFTLYANSVYKMPNLIIGVSKTYAQRANIKGAKSKEFIPVYIGSELHKFEKTDMIQTEGKIEGEIWVTYIGTISYSYDIVTALIAFEKLKDRPEIKLKILGTGQQLEEMKNKAKELKVFNQNVHFYGRLEFDKIITILKQSDIALNAIKGKAKQTITNKFGDYLSAGLPMLNSCREEEVINLINEKQLGLNYEPGNPNSLIFSIQKMLSDKNKMKEYGKNAKLFAEEKFDRKGSYQIILEKINELIRGC